MYWFLVVIVMLSIFVYYVKFKNDFCTTIAVLHYSVVVFIIKFIIEIYIFICFHVWVSKVTLVVKNLPTIAEDLRYTGSIPGSGISLREGNGNPLQYSCLENPMHRGAWQATVHGGISFCFTLFIRSIAWSSPYSKGSYYTEHEYQEVRVMETILQVLYDTQSQGW